jgi:hypothetical protein
MSTSRSSSARSFFTVLVALFVVCSDAEVLRAEESDFDIYARAAEYCRGNAKGPIALDIERRILCFDGAISPGQDISLAKSLGAKGLFVVRSPGGDVTSAIALADLLQDKHATVVVYDYCLLACASFFLFASDETFVLRNSLVAWRYTIDSLWCPSLAAPKDGGSKRLEIAPCSSVPIE